MCVDVFVVVWVMVGYDFVSCFLFVMLLLRMTLCCLWCRAVLIGLCVFVFMIVVCGLWFVVVVAVVLWCCICCDVLWCCDLWCAVSGVL